MSKARFLKVTDANKEIEQGLVDRARQLAGLLRHQHPTKTISGQL
jgi:hypothetical protein